VQEITEHGALAEEIALNDGNGDSDALANDREGNDDHDSGGGFLLD
jgi:hypothetical protein